MYERFGLANVKHVFEPMPHLLWYLVCVLQCAVFPHTPVHHALCSLLLFLHFFLGQSATKLHLKKGPKTTSFFSPSEAKTRKTVPTAGRLQRGLPGASPAAPLTSRGRSGVATKPRPPMHWSGPVYWHMTQPVHTVLARATSAQP